MGAGTCVGLAILFAACGAYSNWWPMFNLIWFLLLPIPSFLCSQLGSDENPTWFAFGEWFTGFLCVSLVGE